jgi:hypothetical protein
VLFDSYHIAPCTQVSSGFWRFETSKGQSGIFMGLVQLEPKADGSANRVILK